MFRETDLLPISALQHLLFCERQCALIHLERLWAENRLTVEGRRLHDRAHSATHESRGDVRIVRGLSLRSLRLGLAGVADVVEFHRGDSVTKPQPMPIEYKRGRPKAHDADRVQLCAQAICIEEMLDTAVPCGALFYGKTRRRQDVAFDQALKRITEQAAERLHAMIASGVTPPARREPKCDNCSLLNLCLPDSFERGRGAADYTRQATRRSLQDTFADAEEMS